MRRKLALASATAALVALLAFAAGASAGVLATVSIKHEQGGFFGVVKSSKASCEAGRKVKLFRLKGNGYDPKNDKLIGSDVAQPNGPNSEWSVQTNAKKGDYYAFAPRKRSAGCKKSFSKVVSL